MPNPSRTQRSQPVQTVLFDYGNVLTNAADPAAWSAMLDLTGLDNARLQAAYWAYRHDYDRHALSCQPYWRAVATHAGVAFSNTQIERLLELDVDMWTSMNQPMVEFAQNLQAVGIRTGILSNIGDSIAQGIVARLSWLANFYHCTWSWSLGLAKPDPAIYLKTAEALGTAPKHILFIDDREENVEAAAALGFQTIQFTAYSAFVEEVRARGYSALLEPRPAAMAGGT
jgi:putative hydrolase of the HAD superfamily